MTQITSEDVYRDHYIEDALDKRYREIGGKVNDINHELNINNV